jgi:hypothetical protein
MKRNISVVLFFLLLSGCAGFQQQKVIDKAGMIALEINKSYLIMYNTALNITNNGSEAQKAFCKERINPKLNEVKPLIIKMDKALAIWKETGIDSFDALKQQEGIQKFLQAISQLLLEVS